MTREKIREEMNLNEDDMTPDGKFADIMPDGTVKMFVTKEARDHNRP